MKRLSTHLFLIVAIGAMVNAPSAQSLADLARREEARRKNIKAPAKVLTNEDLPNVPPPPPPPASSDAAAGGGTETQQAAAGAAPATPQSSSTPAAAAPPSADGATVAPVKDEKYWKQRMTAARDTLSRLQTFQDALQSRINALSTDFVNRDDPGQRAVIGTDRQKAVAELDRVKREIQQAQTDIANTQEEARKAGVPPGWVR